MKKLFFLSLVLTGLGSAASAQVKLKRTAKKQPSAEMVAEKIRIENQNSAASKPVVKKVVVSTPKAEVIVPQQKK